MDSVRQTPKSGRAAGASGQNWPVSAKAAARGMAGEDDRPRRRLPTGTSLKRTEPANRAHFFARARRVVQPAPAPATAPASAPAAEVSCHGIARPSGDARPDSPNRPPSSAFARPRNDKFFGR
ncbi:hypothetical protein A33M_1079 [Rhodovulum sp. PH10]|nr:hypothetical protein A33M_1079 [Rhodovulum sp. PH10]